MGCGGLGIGGCRVRLVILWFGIRGGGFLRWRGCGFAGGLKLGEGLDAAEVAAVEAGLIAG